MDIICVVLGADTKKYRTTDSIKLIEYAFHNFTYVNIEEMISNDFETWKKNNLNSFVIHKGKSNNLDLNYETIPYPMIPIRNDLVNKFNIFITHNRDLDAPIYKNTSIGKITLELENKIIYSGNIIIYNEIQKKTILDYLSYFVKNFANIFNHCIYRL